MPQLLSDQANFSKPALAILGPTASGKSACALALAQHYPVEIISVDSALVYRGMDIGTAKPSLQDQAVCPHHLIDILTPEESYSAARFCHDASTLIEAIRQRRRIPLLVGGTMLYFKALREGLSDLPQADSHIRAQIDADAGRVGWPALHARLAQLDPQAANQLPPNDAQRIQRALEIVLTTGVPLRENYAKKTGINPLFNIRYLALAPSNRSELHTRIATRFENMLAAGFIAEVEQLRRHYALSPELPSMRAVGYRQAWEFLEGKDSYDAFCQKSLAATRQLAKRQLTWQRQFQENWPDLTQLDCLSPQLEGEVLAWASKSLN